MLKKIVAIGLFSLLASGAQAGGSKYELSFSGEPISALQISSVIVTPSKDVAAETEIYDSRDVDVLKSVLLKKMTTKLSQKGLLADDGAVLELVITELKPNRPTIAQYRSKPGLSFESIALGGASVEGRLIDANGNILAEVDFSWEETWIDQVHGSTTWYDARLAFDRLSRKLARDLSTNSAS